MSASAAALGRVEGPASFFRVLFVGGLIAYRALFNWIRPAIYIPTMLGSPLFQILFFAKLGEYARLGDVDFFVVGNAVQVCSMSAIYGATMTLANERYFGTISQLLATPANRAALFLGRSLPVIANGLLVSVFGFLVGALFLDFRMPVGQMPAVALVVILTVVSCTGFGMMLGSIGIRARDVFFASNLAYFVMLLMCGVNIPIESLPGWMQAISKVLPLTHGIEAARDLAAGAALGDVTDSIVSEVATGFSYGLIAFVLFRYFERASRHHAALDRF